MKKRRGKQPVKPNIEEAMKERLVYLKGAQGSTMNIPIIYRRTFGWDSDSIVFRPINRRSFVVYRSDLDQEEIDLENYKVRELDVSDLPRYSGERMDGDVESVSKIEELTEALVSLSLTDRYVHIDVKRLEDHDLDEMLRGDLERLSSELGYSYSITRNAYRCTFLFPKHSNSQMVLKASNVLKGSLQAVNSLIDEIMDLDIKKMGRRLSDLEYLIGRAEVNMDQIYTNALNVHWDMPQTEPVGYFLLTQSCERAHDELEYIVDATKEALDLLGGCHDDASKVLFEELVSLWRTSVGRAVLNLQRGLEALEMEKEASMERSYLMIREYRERKESRTSNQDKVITQLTRKIEGLAQRGAKKGGLKFLTNVGCLATIEMLFGINRSASRIGSITNVIVTKNLYLKQTS
ncbi:MAG: hypothetical protein U9R75_06815 [Candidatus Thermoplasmatota archaeon]|nr:hypothetical protein [Candidatus Thermoplasmatota archaeon]